MAQAHFSQRQGVLHPLKTVGRFGIPTGNDHVAPKIYLSAQQGFGDAPPNT
jgi:hypothetical protein